MRDRRAPGELTESEATARGITEREVADSYRSTASAYVRDNLDRLPLVVAAHEAWAWSIWNPRDLARRDAHESRSYGFQVRARPFEAVFALAGAAGLVVLVRRQGVRAVVVVAPVLAVVVSVAVSYGNPRFNVTAQPSLAIAFAALIGVPLGWWRHRGTPPPERSSGPGPAVADPRRADRPVSARRAPGSAQVELGHPATGDGHRRQRRTGIVEQVVGALGTSGKTAVQASRCRSPGGAPPCGTGRRVRPGRLRARRWGAAPAR